jgi:LuxR family maltose regulon positive regulatory protein
LAQQALHQLPVDALALRALAVLNIGSIKLQLGDRITANAALTAAMTWGSAVGADYIVLAAVEELATEQIRQGQLAAAKQTCEQALTRVSRGNNRPPPAAGMLHITLGEVLVERNELAQAAQVLTQGVSLLQGTTEMGMLARGYGALARCQSAGGERAPALATLQQGEAWLAQIQTASPGTYARLAAERARLHLRQGDLVAALAWAQESHPLGESLLSYLQQFIHVRIWLAQSVRDPQASFLAEAANVLAPLLVNAEAKGWDGHLIEILLLQALLAQAQGKRAAAHTLLTRALTLAEPAGYVRLFVEEGEALRKLIAECGIRNAELSTSLRPYVDKLLAAFDQGKEETKAQEAASTLRTPYSALRTLVEPLSARELEVLHLAAAGLSNTEIAARLIVATSTIKTHINRLFGKLAVQSRTQAIARARELGLLND